MFESTVQMETKCSNFSCFLDDEFLEGEMRQIEHSFGIFHTKSKYNRCAHYYIQFLKKFHL